MSYDKNWMNVWPKQSFYGENLYPEIQLKHLTYFDDFVYKGKSYKINSIVKISKAAKRYLGADNCYTQIIEHYKVNGTEKECWTYITKFKFDKIFKTRTNVPPDELVEDVVCPYVAINKTNEPSYYKDYEVPEVIVGWGIYIFVLLFSLIFKGTIGIWAIVSIYFFVWRTSRLKKPPKHDYGFDRDEINKWRDLDNE